MNIYIIFFIILIIFLIYFTRDAYIIPINPSFNNTVIKPCDGELIDIIETSEYLSLHWFLSIFDNHTQYVPINGYVIDIKRIKGARYPANVKKSNENNKIITTFRTYDNGIVIPKDFNKYEGNLWKLVRYVDKIICEPNKDTPARQLWEIAQMKYEVVVNIEDIDRYFEAGGRFHKEELRKVQGFLEGRLNRLHWEIPKITNLMYKANSIK